jgi:hypothetical protein
LSPSATEVELLNAVVLRGINTETREWSREGSVTVVEATLLVLETRSLRLLLPLLNCTPPAAVAGVSFAVSVLWHSHQRVRLVSPSAWWWSWLRQQPAWWLRPPVSVVLRR